MIKIEHTETYGFEAAIRGMRNPMNSWDKSDSESYQYGFDITFKLGENDLELMKQLVKAGTDHSKFMRMITVTCDITAPLYWWKEFDTYKVGTVRNSCSTMHTIHKKEFELEDFSHEYLCGMAADVMRRTILVLNLFREQYLMGKDTNDWYQMIQLLPSSYNQRATVQMNYAVLRNMYHARKNHKLTEWNDFCEWIESLTYSGLITEDTD